MGEKLITSEGIDERWMRKNVHSFLGDFEAEIVVLLDSEDHYTFLLTQRQSNDCFVCADANFMRF